MPSPARAGVTLERLTKRFGAVEAVRDLSLEIDEAEFFCLLGPSGCGKTTTLRLIAGFEEATGGAAESRDDRDRQSNSSSARASTAASS